MTPRFRFLSLAGLIICLTSGVLYAADAGKPPNILFIFADDQSFETIHALGNREIETPHLDRLVNSSMTFTHAYNQGSWSGAVCVASRTMLVTGRFLWRAHSVYGQSEKERQAGRFWPEYMKQAGYDTYFTGKWHIRADANQAFDTAAHVRGGMPKQTPLGYDRPLAEGEDKWSPFDKSFGGFWAGGKHWSEVVADDAVGFLRRAAGRDKPFFMYIAFNAPHDPRQSPKEYVDKYPLEKVAVPANFQAEYPFNQAMGCGRNLRDERLAPFPRTRQAVKVHRQEYYAIITHMDAQIGRIVKALEKSGQADNTYIIFTADHGLAVGHHGLFGKQNMYDHSVRVPLMVTGPGVPQGKRNGAPVYLQDVMPTSLELSGVERPGHVQFKSLVPLLKGSEEKPYAAMYGAYLSLQRMVTQDGYKLILYPKIKKARLFNVKEDPLESRDLAGDEGRQGTIKKLFAKLLELQKETGDTLDLKSAYPQF